MDTNIGSDLEKVSAILLENGITTHEDLRKAVSGWRNQMKVAEVVGAESWPTWQHILGAAKNLKDAVAQDSKAFGRINKALRVPPNLDPESTAAEVEALYNGFEDLEDERNSLQGELTLQSNNATYFRKYGEDREKEIVALRAKFTRELAEIIDPSGEYDDWEFDGLLAEVRELKSQKDELKQTLEDLWNADNAATRAKDELEELLYADDGGYTWDEIVHEVRCLKELHDSADNGRKTLLAQLNERRIEMWEALGNDEWNAPDWGDVRSAVTRSAEGARQVEFLKKACNGYYKFQNDMADALGIKHSMWDAKSLIYTAKIIRGDRTYLDKQAEGFRTEIRQLKIATDNQSLRNELARLHADKNILQASNSEWRRFSQNVEAIISPDKRLFGHEKILEALRNLRKGYDECTEEWNEQDWTLVEIRAALTRANCTACGVVHNYGDLADSIKAILDGKS